MPRSASLRLYFHSVPTYLRARGGAEPAGMHVGWNGGSRAVRSWAPMRGAAQPMAATLQQSTLAAKASQLLRGTKCQPPQLMIRPCSLRDQLPLLKSLHQHLTRHQRRVGRLQAWHGRRGGRVGLQAPGKATPEQLAQPTLLEGRTAKAFVLAGLTGGMQPACCRARQAGEEAPGGRRRRSSGGSCGRRRPGGPPR